MDSFGTCLYTIKSTIADKVIEKIKTVKVNRILKLERVPWTPNVKAVNSKEIKVPIFDCTAGIPGLRSSVVVSSNGSSTILSRPSRDQAFHLTPLPSRRSGIHTLLHRERERKAFRSYFFSNMRFSFRSNLKLNINTSFQEVKYCSTAMIAGAYIRPPARGLSHRPPPQILPSSAHSGTGVSPVFKDRLGDEKCIKPSALVPSPPPLRLGSTYPNSTRTLWRG